MRIEDKILLQKAEPSVLRIADDLFCNFLPNVAHSLAWLPLPIQFM